MLECKLAGRPWHWGTVPDQRAADRGRNEKCCAKRQARNSGATRSGWHATGSPFRQSGSSDPGSFPQAQTCVTDPKRNCCAESVAESFAVYSRFEIQAGVPRFILCGVPVGRSGCGKMLRKKPGSVEPTSEEAGPDAQKGRDKSCASMPQVHSGCAVPECAVGRPAPASGAGRTVSDQFRMPAQRGHGTQGEGLALRFLRYGVVARCGCPPKLKADKGLQDGQGTKHRLTPLPRREASTGVERRKEGRERAARLGQFCGAEARVASRGSRSSSPP
jgi:hypothetical protein